MTNNARELKISTMNGQDGLNPQEVLAFIKQINVAELTTALISSGFRILLILAGSWLITRVAHAVIHKYILGFIKSQIAKGEKKARVEKKIATVHSVILATLRIVIFSLAGLMVLSELGVNITPILTGVGIAGLALGFGARKLVEDIISGFFILLEGQYAIGDRIKIGDVYGDVAGFNLRKTIVTGVDGVEHHITNGAVRSVANYSRQYSRFVFDVGVSYEAPPEKVLAVLEKTLKDFYRNKEHRERFLEEPKVLGLDSFGDSAINYKVFGKTKPLEQFGLERELKLAIKDSLDKAGIDIPFPQRVVTLKK